MNSKLTKNLRIISTIVGVLALLVSIASWYKLAVASSTNSWLETQGEITEVSRAEKRIIKLRYNYEVKGQTTSGKQGASGLRNSLSLRDDLQWKRGPATVYYDPTSVNNSVLYRGIHPVLIQQTIWSTGVLLICVGSLIWLVRNK